MVVSIQEKKEGVLKRMKTIADHFNLGDKLVNYLTEDKLYYSYAYSMDTINYDERYARAAKAFERERGVYVYHAIKAKAQNGYTLLSLLFVFACELACLVLCCGEETEILNFTLQI